MDVEFHEEMSPIGGAKPAAGNSQRARGQIHESVTIGSGSSEPVRDVAAGSVEQESVTVGKGGRGLGLSPTARKMLENIDKHGTVSDEPPDVPKPDSPPAAGAPAAAVAPTQATPPETSTPPAAAAAPSTAPAKSTEDAIAEHKARADRFAEHNTRLVTELEQLRARPARGEPTAREKALDEAERTIMEDSIGALRRVYATALGVDDPKHPDVDKHLTWLYHDLTERELGVPLDPSIKAQRESERVRHLLARDKRDRAADATKPAPVQDPDAAEAATKVPLVAQFIGAGDHATKYPLLRTLSADFDGMKPEELLWKELNRGFKTGEYNRADQDTNLIDLASRKIESHYQALAEKIAKATQKAPAASTATPTQAAVATDQKAEPQGNGPRTITNASASVAPATTPAAKPAPTETTPKKTWKNEKERIRALAAKHFGDA
jgi:hypothetical protein